MNNNLSTPIFPYALQDEQLVGLAEERLTTYLQRGMEADPFGHQPEHFQRRFRQLLPLYMHYFRVRSHGHQHLTLDQTIVIANHSGQLPIDAVLLTMDYFMSHPKVVLLRSMVERFVIKLPFIGRLAQEAGAVLGDRQNAQYLLERGESLLIFPEGAKGISKPTAQHYQLEAFSTGYVKMALQHDCPIQPVVIIGAEELYPWVWNFNLMAKWLKIPALPLAFPNGLIPLPAPIDIYYGAPCYPRRELGANPAHSLLMGWIEEQRQRMQQDIFEYLPQKRSVLDEELRWKMKQWGQVWLNTLLGSKKDY
jgi:1-acyl-sn-glycerol-3-phosphate acyltransferase